MAVGRPSLGGVRRRGFERCRKMPCPAQSRGRRPLGMSEDRCQGHQRRGIYGGSDDRAVTLSGSQSSDLPWAIEVLTRKAAL